MGLTGKQIRERGQEREVKRTKKRKNHQKKREADIAKLLNEHEEDVATYQSFKEPSFLPESPLISRCTNQKNSMYSSSKNYHVESRSHTNLHVRSRSGISNLKMFGLNNYFKDKTEEWKKRQEGLVQSPLTVDEHEEGRKEYVVENKGESSASLQLELYYLKKCLQSQKKEKLTSDVKSKDKSVPLDHSLLPANKCNSGYSHHNSSVFLAVTGNEATKSVPKECSSRHSLPLSGTLALPLDRISEIASDISDTSFSESHQEAKEVTSAGEDASTDSSWIVPREVKNLLDSNP